MAYSKLFDPTDLEDLRSGDEKLQTTTGDRRDGRVYVYDDAGEIVLAVNIALATGRPLLISGPSGGGKSSLAQHIARVLGRRYYEFVVTARTQAQDLTWRFDAVRRLADAQIRDAFKDLNPIDTIYPYIEPQVLWWIFDRQDALNRGRKPITATGEPAASTSPQGSSADPIVRAVQQPADPVKWDPSCADPSKERLPEEPQLESCVLLIDEIDKADPDVPNNLLVELGSFQFDVDLIGKLVEFQGKRDDWRLRPLVIITTNNERPLPQPFIRRCIVLELPKPKRKLLKSIGKRNVLDQSDAFFDSVLDAVLSSRGQPASGPSTSTAPTPPASEQQLTASRDDEIADVSIAEYIDTLRACTTLAKGTDQLSQVLLNDIVKRTIRTVKDKSLRPQ